MSGIGPARGRHFLDQKKVAKESAAQGLFLIDTPVAPEVRASLSLPRESDKERPGSPPGPRARRQPSSGGCRPGPPAVRGEIWASATPWLGCGKWGPKGSLEPAGWPPLARKSFQPSAFRILSPFSALVVYSESGAQPSAIQTLLSRTWQRAPARPGCRAPREAFRFTELPTALPGGERRLGTGHETNGGPSRSHPAQPVALEGSRGLPGQSLATFF